MATRTVWHRTPKLPRKLKDYDLSCDKPGDVETLFSGTVAVYPFGEQYNTNLEFLTDVNDKPATAWQLTRLSSIIHKQLKSTKEKSRDGIYFLDDASNPMLWNSMRKYLEGTGATFKVIHKHSKLEITWTKKPWWLEAKYIRIDGSKSEVHICEKLPFILTISVKTGNTVIGIGIQTYSAQGVCQNILPCECGCGCAVCSSKYMKDH